MVYTAIALDAPTDVSLVLISRFCDWTPQLRDEERRMGRMGDTMANVLGGMGS